MCYIDYNSICTQCGKFSCDCGHKTEYINSRCAMCGEKNTLLEPCNCQTPAIDYNKLVKAVEDAAADPCPGRSQKKCPYCRKCHSVFEICKDNPNYMTGINIDELIPAPMPEYVHPGTITTSSHTLWPVKDTKDLEELYDELGKCNWLGADDGWDRAIDTVREHIREKIGK